MDKNKLLNRFISYVTIDTESDPNSSATPSTEKQWVLANKLADELREMGMQNVDIDDKAYVMATLPSNVEKEVPTIGFIAHFDTSPDFCGANVKPQLIQNYDGGDIVLNAEKNIVLSPDYFEDLLDYKGQNLVTTDGNTLLGADDKAGITEIMEAMQYLISHPEIPHGTIKVGFTPDEEIGRGAHHFDVEKFGADWAYTMDGSQIGELEYENFNAAGATLTIKGKSVHPGYAKNKMVNSIQIGQQLLGMLPTEAVPERTTKKEGFYHVYQFEGGIEETKISMIIRDHDMQLFQEKKAYLEQLVQDFNKKFNDAVSLHMVDQYYNMREKIIPVFHIVEIAETAMKNLGIQPVVKAIRGGTDGAQLSYKGLPCPNIFAGGHNFHGKYEYVPVESMIKATAVIVEIAKLTAQER
ncbi:MAG: peptidase T [Flavobacteriaceae bacterium]|nr:peptidase T [Flavobacteriaceae bacterium]